MVLQAESRQIPANGLKPWLGWLSKAPEEAEGSLQRGSVTCSTALAEDTGQLQRQIQEVGGGGGGLWVTLERGWGMEASGWGGAGVPSVVEVGQVSPVPQSFFAPLGLMFCHECGGSVSPVWENLKSPRFSVPLFFHTLWTVLPLSLPTSSLLVPLPVPFPHPAPQFLSHQPPPTLRNGLGSSPCWFPLRTDAQGQGQLSPQMWGAEVGLCQTRGCPGSVPGQTRCEELWAPGREGMKPRAGQGLQAGEQP